VKNRRQKEPATPRTGADAETAERSYPSRPTMTASQLSRPRKQNGLNPTKPPTTDVTCGGRPVFEEPHAEVPIQCSCSSRSLSRTNGGDLGLFAWFD
jgi:hypothetical protein